MAKFQIEPHDRLQEWVAEEKGYFKAQGLDYEFILGERASVLSHLPQQGASEIKRGATEYFEEDRGGHVSCACQWAVNIASATRHGKLWPKSYVVTPAAIYVQPGSSVKKAEDLAGVEVAAGYRSGSHFSALQALESTLPRDQIKLVFKGRPDMRVGSLLSGEVESANIIGFLVRRDVDTAELEKYFRAIRSAQRDIDLDPAPYKHYYLRHLKEPLRSLADVRTFGPGERIVFEPYTQEMFEESVKWMESWGLNPEMQGTSDYEAAALL